MDIHIDFVSNFVGMNRDKDGLYNFKKLWPPYDIDFKKIRKISYLVVKTYAPSSEDTFSVLSKQYGENYLIPEKKYNYPPWIKNTNIKRVISFGTYDLFHIGHLNILNNAKNIYPHTYLVIGISSDNFNIKKKNIKPIINEKNRLKIIKNLKCVDECFFEESLKLKLKYCIDFNIDTLVMGDDHKGRFDYLKIYGINVIYFPRTKNISSSEIINKIKLNS